MTPLPDKPMSSSTMPWHRHPDPKVAFKTEAAWRNAPTPDAKAEVHRAYCAANGLPDPYAREPEAGL
jgi:hypothetical protein